MSYIQICATCKSTDVARLKWVNVNSGIIYDAYSGIETEWCFKCKEQTTILEKLSCPECSDPVTQDELDMFDGYCENCFENINRMLEEDTK